MPAVQQDAGMASAVKALERYVNAMITDSSRLVQSIAILPLAPVDPVVAHARKSIVLVQKGIGLRAPEAATILERMLAGTLHRDYVYAAGSQYMVTSVHRRSAYARVTATGNTGGLVVVKTHKLLLVATYADPVLEAEAVPQVEKFADELICHDF